MSIILQQIIALALGAALGIISMPKFISWACKNWSKRGRSKGMLALLLLLWTSIVVIVGVTAAAAVALGAIAYDAMAPVPFVRGMSGLIALAALLLYVIGLIEKATEKRWPMCPVCGNDRSPRHRHLSENVVRYI